MTMTGTEPTARIWRRWGRYAVSHRQTIWTTTYCCARAFSAPGQKITERHTSLKPDTVDRILFLQSNLV